MDAFSTLVLDSIAIRDQNGALVPGLALEAVPGRSGYNFLNAVPEPGTAVLAGVGLALLGAKRRPQR